MNLPKLNYASHIVTRSNSLNQKDFISLLVLAFNENTYIAFIQTVRNRSINLH